MYSIINNININNNNNNDNMMFTNSSIIDIIIPNFCLHGKGPRSFTLTAHVQCLSDAGQTNGTDPPADRTGVALLV